MSIFKAIAAIGVNSDPAEFIQFFLNQVSRCLAEVLEVFVKSVSPVSGQLRESVSRYVAISLMVLKPYFFNPV